MKILNGVAPNGFRLSEMMRLPDCDATLVGITTMAYHLQTKVPDRNRSEVLPMGVEVADVAATVRKLVDDEFLTVDTFTDRLANGEFSMC